MESKIKDTISRSIDELKNLEDRLDDLLDELPDDVEDVSDSVRRTLKSTLQTIGNKLDGSMSQVVESGERLSEEAELQAHLGLMEAQDKLASSKKVFEHYLNDAEDSSRTLLDELELKAHLARMEATDFWEERGPELSDEFAKSAEKMAKVAGSAAEEIQQQFSKWNAVFSNRRKGPDA